MKTPALTLTLAAALLLLLAQPSAYAAMIGTQEVLDAQTERDKVSEFFHRADVEERLQAMDIPAAVARSRVSALTPAEVATLAQRIDALPAAGALSGSDFVIILLVAILVALLL
ncbi:PA2779 family protein [Pseudomonas sp.]|jgi:hypothetical protein|uniref:PA2779 family protein n=1 Tax=Pseudomonas sp. TaxID=306 RepID=UPI002731627A|nr:PA2779 family protein [Pseudomonas sp.]MDP2243931.1 PA2779 family protein [Pseudomonas sp.]